MAYAINTGMLTRCVPVRGGLSIQSAKPRSSLHRVVWIVYALLARSSRCVLASVPHDRRRTVADPPLPAQYAVVPEKFIYFAFFFALSKRASARSCLNRQIPDLHSFADSRPHWFQCSAAKARWEEEVHLRREEMFRVLMYFRHYYEHWIQVAGKSSLEGRHGAAAYARR